MADTATTGAQALQKKKLTDDTGLGVTGSAESVGPTTPDLTSLSQALARQYNNAQYTVRSNEDRMAQARLENDTYYSQMRRAATQQQEANDLRLRQQRDALQSAYDRNRQQSAQQYAQAYSQADRQMLARGMGRSSYALQTLAGVANQGAAAQGEIDRQQAEAEREIEDQRTQLSSQLQATLAGYEAEQAKDVQKRFQEMEEQDYDRNVAAAERQTNIAQQLYTNMYQQQRDTEADAQWLRQQNEAIREWNLAHGYKAWSGKLTGAGTNTAADTYYTVAKTQKKKAASSSGGGSSGGSSGSGSGKKKTPTGSGSSLLDVINGLSSGGSSSGGASLSSVKQGYSNLKYSTSPGQ